MTKAMMILSGLGLLICIILGFAMKDGVGAIPSAHISYLKMLVLHTGVVRWNWVVPAIFSFVLILFMACFCSEVYKDNLLNSKSYTSVIVLVFIMGVGTQLLTWLLYQDYIGFGIAYKIGLWTCVFILAVLGNYMSTARKSWFSGFPTPWAMKSNLAWEKMHRFLGRGTILISFCLGIFLFAGAPLLGFSVSVDAFTVLIIVSTIYSWMVWRKDPNREEFGKRKA